MRQGGTRSVGCVKGSSGECTELLSAQAVGNALYGLQNMSSESKEVRDLLVVLRDQVGQVHRAAESSSSRECTVGYRI